MTKLQELQNNFQDFLLHSTSHIYPDIISTPEISAKIRLHIYKDAYQLRLIEALTTTYPLLAQRLGSKQLKNICNKYIAKYPSSNRSIRWFGDQLSHFLLDEFEQSSYLSELALLEWTMSLVFDAEDKSILELDSLKSIPSERWMDMIFITHPSIYRLNFKWNTIAIWKNLLLNRKSLKPKKNLGEERWIFWRKELDTQYALLSATEAWAIDFILQGGTFGQLCEGLCEWLNESEVSLSAASFLKGWIAAGLITDYQF